MLHLTGYQIHECIYESLSSRVYRGQRECDGQAVILKELNAEYPSPDERLRYRREYEFTHTLDLEGVITAYSLETAQHALVIVFEDFGAQSLQILLMKQRFSLKEFLTIALKIADSLAQIHATSIIHKDLNPSNIVLNPSTGQLKLIDFGIATRLSRENPTIRHPNVLEGTLAYMSPEQTGRMNRSVDYRTDLYSLGVTLYELLTGQLPFTTDDPLEVVHCHLAKMPVPPCDLTLSLRREGEQNHPSPRRRGAGGEVISDIIMKLMAKTAEERYQSAIGLKKDLQRCLDSLNSAGTIEPFDIGQHDVSGRFQIPETLYGREEEIQLLLQVFERVSAGTTELLLVTGEAGVGKSSLVQEVHKPITEKRGHFIAGKFDQFQRDVPYSALIQAFQSLVSLLLTEKEDVLTVWRTHILNAVGNLGKVLTNVIPNLELVIGKQPEIPELGPAQAQNRFNLVFGNFVSAIARQEHPLVLALDDLQWADSASLTLLKVLVTDQDLRYLLFIGVYRENELGPSHPLSITLEELKQEQANIPTIRLHNLSQEHARDLIADTLLHPEGIEGLVSLVYKKTRGNAFFVKQLFQALYDDQLLKFDVAAQCWQWDLAAIQQVGMTDNVVELMAAKVQKLPATTQHILTLAACIGNRFDLDTLAIIAERTPHDTAQTLHPALMEGLIIETGNWKLETGNWKPGAESSSVLFPVSSFQFSHDRIQEAAYSLIPNNQKAPVHLKIGKLLRDRIPQDQQAERIFEIVNQLNAGRILLDQPEDLIMLAELNLQVGRKAKASGAYHPALKHFEIGIELLSEESWESYHTLTFALYRERYECEYLTAHFDEAERLFALILAHTTSKWEQAEIYNIGITQYAMMTKYEEAIRTGREALKLFGMELPEHDLQTAIKQEFAAVQINLGGQTIADLLHLPLMTDPEQKAIIKLLLSLGPPTYQGHHLDLSRFNCARAINIILNYGTTQETPVWYVNYGTSLRNYLGEYQAGYEFGKVGIQLSETFQNAAQQCRTFHNFAKFINPWWMPLKTSVPLEKQALRYALESGELMFAGYALGGLIEALLLKGDELGRVLEELEHAIQFVSKTKSKIKIYLFSVYRQLIRCLQGRTQDTQTFNDHNFDEVRFLEDVKELPIQICRFSICKLQSLYTYEHHTEALSMAKEAENGLANISSMVQAAEQNFYYSLTLCALYPRANGEQQQRYKEKLRANQAQMKIWADNCPENFLHKYLLVEAEIARIEGRKWDAVECYRKAIEEARTNEFVQHEALSNELLAKFWLAQDEEKIAQVYMTDAHYGYRLWGAAGKVKDLEQKYPQLLATRPEKTGHLDSRTTTPLPLTGSRSDDLLDFSTVMKASHTIAGEIVLESLLTKMMKIVIENAGAQTGYLMLEKSGQWVIEAEGAIDTTDVKVLHSININQSEEVSAHIIRYVAHTQESVVLHDAANEGNFTHDPHIVKGNPKSILCLPLLHRGNLSGILYLENNLTVGAFTSKRLEVLDILSSQMAISLENAILYNNLDHKVKERTLLLEEQRERFQKLSEATFEGILIHDTGRILEVNQTLEQMFGYQRSDILGRHVLDFVTPDSRDVVRRHIQAGDEHPYEAAAIRKDGAIFPIEVQAKTMPYQGRNVRVAAVRDLTWQRTIEAEKAQLHQENITLRSTIKDRYKFGEIIGRSPVMQQVYEQIVHAAASEANVVITGESGTGKELVAHTIHQQSNRRDKPFLPVNCGAVPEALFESEFFGHRKGAFTGADREKAGFFEVAHGGTLFLDEVGELSPVMQVKLLRAIQSGEYTPIGDTRVRQVDVRIIAATNRNLVEQREQGLIRDDFFYRICVLAITVPPLRERKEDIPLLVDYFLEHYAAGETRPTIPSHLMEALVRHGWPGNVRELQNVLQRYLAGEHLEFFGHFKTRSEEQGGVSDLAFEQKGLSFREALEAYEKRLIVKALEQNQGHIGKTAEILDLPQRTLYRKIKKYQLL